MCYLRDKMSHIGVSALLRPSLIAVVIRKLFALTVSSQYYNVE
jgi:hypothetical protein